MRLEALRAAISRRAATVDGSAWHGRAACSLRASRQHGQRRRLIIAFFCCIAGGVRATSEGVDFRKRLGSEAAESAFTELEYELQRVQELHAAAFNKMAKAYNAETKRKLMAQHTLLKTSGCITHLKSKRGCTVKYLLANLPYALTTISRRTSPA